MRKGWFLGVPVQILDLSLIVQAIKEDGLDYVYEVLEKLLLTEPFVVINGEGKVVFFPMDTEEIWDFLGLVDKKFNNTEEVEQCEG